MYAYMPAVWLINITVKTVSYLLTRRKAVLSCLLAAVMLLGTMPITAFADITEGTGTTNYPYKINTAEDLLWFAAKFNGGDLEQSELE